MLDKAIKIIKDIFKHIPWIFAGFVLGMLLIEKVNITQEVREVSVLESSEEMEVTSEEETIKVYITGEVKKPDVYSLPDNSRLEDLVEKAGGFTDEAYRDNLNYAKILEDGSKVIVRNINDVVDENGNLKDNIYGKAAKDKININTADRDTLAEMDGLNEELADNIITYRKDYGDYTSIEEIKEAEGIGDVIFNKIKDKITIE